MFRHVLLGFIVFLPQLTVVVADLCNANNCADCLRSRFIQCRWCKRDDTCHTPSADAVRSCNTEEYVVQHSHCEDGVPHYVPEVSLKMSLLSAVAYAPSHKQECLEKVLPSEKFQLQRVVTRKCDMFENECSGYVAVSHALKAVVLAFRGSANYEQAILEFLESLVFPEVNFLNGKIQSYWRRAFYVLWSSMEAEVKVLVRKNPSYQIWVTGHSLGGAMASLASTWLAYHNIAPRKNIISYTFGMPRVGNYDYALQHDQLVNNSWRVVNFNDLVPHVPSINGTPNKERGPYHHGVEVFYREEAVRVNSPHRECHGKPYNEDATCSFSEKELSIPRHLEYFGIRFGSYWETKCGNGSSIVKLDKQTLIYDSINDNRIIDSNR